MLKEQFLSLPLSPVPQIDIKTMAGVKSTYYRNNSQDERSICMSCRWIRNIKCMGSKDALPPSTPRIDHPYQDPHESDPRLVLHYGDLTDSTNLIRIIQQVQPDEIYNLGAQSHVAVSFESPEYTANSDALGTLRILEAVRILGLTEKTRIYQASTSELYGLVQRFRRKRVRLYPRSPYGVAKLYAYWITVNYRESHGMYACNGILFNHESPRRVKHL